jgi:hypothetical protein
MATRTADTYWESCYYLLKADTSVWRSDAMIYIYLESSSTVNMNVWEGSSRRNASLVVEGNSTLQVGAPIRVPISSGSIITL